MTDDDAFKLRVDLLKTELTLLDGKMRTIVERLWQIRALCGTIWAALIAIGLGAGTGSRNPIYELLWLSVFVPIWFAWIDSSYQSWYQVFRMREKAISDFINNSHSGSHGKWNGFDDALRTLHFDFPLMDLRGHFTYGDDPDYKWSISRWSRLFDTTPVLTFGGLLAGSLVLCFLQPGRLPSWLAIVVGLIVAAVAYGIASWKRKTIYRKAAGESPQPGWEGSSSAFMLTAFLSIGILWLG